MYLIIHFQNNTRHLTRLCTKTLCGIDCSPGRDTGFFAPMKIDEKDIINEPNICAPCCIAAGLSEPKPVPFVAPDHIEFIAKALCRGDGKNPNVMVPAFDDPDKSVNTGDMFMGIRHEQWKEYRATAHRFIVAFRAIQGLL